MAGYGCTSLCQLFSIADKFLLQGEAPYPICVGHEIVGNVVRVGSKAEGNFKIGDRVGVGAQSDSCLNRWGDCDPCSNGLEVYCVKKAVHTFGGFHYNGDKAMGGHATYHRCPSHFVFMIPEGLESGGVGPMLCGGISVYSPLRYHKCGPGKKVGVIGVGGLGHFAILFAKALGADKVVGISRSSSKRNEVLKMGADEYIATAEEPDWAKTHRNSLDIVVSTVSSNKAPFREYMDLLRLDGTFIQVGLPDDGPFQLDAGILVDRRIKLTGSNIGSPAEIREMLELAAAKNIKPWVQQLPMSEANQAMLDFEAGKARYRYVLTQ